MRRPLLIVRVRPTSRMAPLPPFRAPSLKPHPFQNWGDVSFVRQIPERPRTKARFSGSLSLYVAVRVQAHQDHQALTCLLQCFPELQMVIYNPSQSYRSGLCVAILRRRIGQNACSGDFQGLKSMSLEGWLAENLPIFPRSLLLSFAAQKAR